MEPSRLEVMPDSGAAHARVTHDDDRLGRIELAAAARDLSHRYVHRAVDAGDRELPRLADVKKRQILAASPSGHERGGGQLLHERQN